MVLPEGARLTGEVVSAKRARHFHRAGQLRFNFQKVDLPQEATNLQPAQARPAHMKTQATVAAAEGSGKAPIQVDSEGGVQAKESKTRFIAPAISVLLPARRATRTPPGFRRTRCICGWRCACLRTDRGRRLGFGNVGRGDIAELPVCRDGLRLLRISVGRVFERFRARGRSGV